MKKRIKKFIPAILLILLILILKNNSLLFTSFFLVVISLVLSLHRLVHGSIPFEIETITITCIFFSYNYSFWAGWIIGSVLVLFSLIIARRLSPLNLIKFLSLGAISYLAVQFSYLPFTVIASVLVFVYNFILFISYSFTGLPVLKNISYQGSSMLTNLTFLFLYLY